jgi:hypothetical protein
MSNVTVVHTKSELELAIERRDKTIAVKSASLADDVQASLLPISGIRWAGAQVLSERYLQGR